MQIANFGFGIDFIRSRMITYAILYHFPVNFAYGSEMWSARFLLFMRQTRSIRTILEVCEIPIFASFTIALAMFFHVSSQEFE